MSTPDDVLRLLAEAYPDASEHLRGLRDRLAAAAQADGILDLAYRTVDSPVGPLLLAATELGLVRVAYASEDHNEVLQALSDRISPRVLHAPERLGLSHDRLDGSAGREAPPHLTSTEHASEPPTVP